MAFSNMRIHLLLKTRNHEEMPYFVFCSNGKLSLVSVLKPLSFETAQTLYKQLIIKIIN